MTTTVFPYKQRACCVLYFNLADRQVDSRNHREEACTCIHLDRCCGAKSKTGVECPSSQYPTAAGQSRTSSKGDGGGGGVMAALISLHAGSVAEQWYSSLISLHAGSVAEQWYSYLISLHAGSVAEQWYSSLISNGTPLSSPSILGQ